jgi:hypothetical protein
MYKIEHRKQQPDILFALPGPIRAMEEVSFETHLGETVSMPQLPVTEDMWHSVGPLPTADEYLNGSFILPHRAQAVALDRVACANCGCVGGLVSQRWPAAEDDSWPSFGENCPVCNGALRWVYDDTIN